jgi:hydroxymethylpyrimidine/phosphomethylpyrimidine kinase
MNKNKPVIACFSGNDPSGGAGIQADIETLGKLSCHSLPLITLNTLQDSKGITNTVKTPDDFLEQQFDALQNDLEITAIKVGMLADVSQIETLEKIIKKSAVDTVVLDTVFSSGLGSEQKKPAFVKHFCGKLLPLATLITPNATEAKKIASALNNDNEASENNETNAQFIAKKSGAQVLVTGTHSRETENTIEHHYCYKGQHQLFKNERLAQSFHGSGCTLASAITAHLVNSTSAGKQMNKEDMEEVISKALDFTFNSLKQGQPLGKHQYFPNRFFQ